MEQTFAVAASADAAWTALCEPGTALSCVPANVTGSSDRAWFGVMALEIAGRSLLYHGSLRVVCADVAGRSVSLQADARDLRFASVLAATVTMTVQSVDPNNARLLIDTDLHVSSPAFAATAAGLDHAAALDEAVSAFWAGFADVLEERLEKRRRSETTSVYAV